jgi:ParB family chromosome partitioning protein
LRQVRVASIDIPSRPARRFLGDIAALGESMQDYGLQQPISVRADRNRFILTSGLRRLEAARLLGWKNIPAFVRTVDADHAYLLDLIENLQREDLSPEEEADALLELIRTRGWTMRQVADGIKRSVGFVSKRVRVFQDPLLRQAIVERGLPVSTAEELLAADDSERAALVDQAIAERWDQTYARQALRAADAVSMAVQVVSEALEDEQSDVSEPAGDRAALPPGRPRGFTRAIREFHELVRGVVASDLFDADRAALRALYRDLTMLARAPSKPQAPVFPPLPSATTSSSSPSQRGSRSARARR